MTHYQMMPRYRSRMAMRPIQRIKHVVDASATLTKNTQLNQQMIRAKDAPILANTTEVLTGSKVYGIYLKVEVASNEVATAGAIPNVYLMVGKNPANALTTPAANAVGSSDVKRMILHQEMIMIENSGKGGNARILFNGVVKIPRGASRFGPDDALHVSVFCPALDIALCIQCHYKEFR